MWARADRRPVAEEEAGSSSLRPEHTALLMLHADRAGCSGSRPGVLLSWPHCVPAQGQITWEQDHVAPALSRLVFGEEHEGS